MRGKHGFHRSLRSAWRRYGVESLEDRCLLAGDLPWRASEPLGSLVYQTEAVGTLTNGADTYSLELASGQEFSARASTDPSLRLQLELLDGDGQQLAEAIAGEAGELVRLSTTTQSTGPWRLLVTPLAGSTGAYSLELFSGANLEQELPGAATNDEAAVAEDLSAHFQSLGETTATRAAIVGDGGDDWYRFSLSDGQRASLMLVSASNEPLTLYDAQGERLAMSALENDTYQVLRGFKDDTADEAYFIHVPAGAGEYHLVVIRDAVFEQEPNGGLAGAQLLSSDAQVLGHVSPWTEPWRESQLLLPDAVEQDALVGQAVATDGQRVLLGSPGANDATGAVLVYRFDTDRWVFEQQITAPDGGRQDDFGADVAIAGNQIVIGAPRDDEAGTSAGAAYVFRFDGEAWSFQQKLLADDGASNDRFGTAVSVVGNTIAVGAPQDDDLMIGLDIGSVYVYERNGSDWPQAARLRAPDTGQLDLFGTSVALGDGALLVGSPHDDEIATETGSAYVYMRSPEGWEFQQKLFAANGTRRSDFGQAVAWDGDTAIIGAPGRRGAGDDAGAAFVYQFDGQQWFEAQRLDSANSAAGDRFGESVAITGDTLVLGAAQHDEFADNAGAAYVYQRNGNSWESAQKLAALDASAEAQFGSSVAAAEGVLVAGAAGRPMRNPLPDENPATDDGVFTHVGAGYLFAVSSTPLPSSGSVAEIPLMQSAIDRFSFLANAGDELQIAAIAPAGGAGDTRNDLVPMIELLDVDGRLLARSAADPVDSRRGVLEHVVTEASEFYVRVQSANGLAGEYLLTLAGATTGERAFAFDFDETTPGPFASVASASSVVIAFEQALRLDSLSADDLSVDGQPATGLQVLDGRHVRFDLAAPLADGPHSVEVAAQALRNVSGEQNPGQVYMFFVDSFAPRILATSLEPDMVLESGVLTFTLTISQANPLIEDQRVPGLAIERGGVRLVGERSGEYDVRTLGVVELSENAATVRMTFRDLQVDTYTLTVVGGLDGVHDLAGNPLDGEIEGLPIPVGGSGDGVAGGDFVYQFSVATDAPMVTIVDAQAPPGGTATGVLRVENLQGVAAVDVDLAYDASRLRVSGGGFRLGSAAAGWSLAARIDEFAGMIFISLFDADLLTGDGGAFLEIDFQIDEAVPDGTDIPLDLVRVSINEGTIPANVTDSQVRVRIPSFRITATSVGTSGIEFDVDRPLDPATLSLLTGDAADAAPAIQLTGATVGDVRGSFLWNAVEQRLTFLRTGGPLAADDYHLKIPSHAAGILGVAGEILDGDADGLAGGDFVFDFVVGPSSARMLAAPDFARGARQSIVLGALAGIPIALDNAADVRKVEFRFEFDPELLNVNGASRNPSLPADWRITRFDEPDVGIVDFAMEGATPLSAGLQVLMQVLASVPADALAGAAHAIRLETVRVNEGEILAAGDAAIHVASFLGDVDGDGQYTGNDARQVGRVVAGLSRGFAAIAAIEPRLVGDVTGNGDLSSLDAALIARKAFGFDPVEIPDLPTMAAFSFDARTSSEQENAAIRLGPLPTPLQGPQKPDEASETQPNRPFVPFANQIDDATRAMRYDAVMAAATASDWTVPPDAETESRHEAGEDRPADEAFPSRIDV
ncbi:MAG: hypothetical protein KDA42_07870 [Planctomycetales bacterium]|nr:hypothetical protein [Planctomycetales bacterium]